MAMALSGGSCSVSGQSIYTADMVHEATLSEGTLRVAVPLETVYFMAGANIIDQSDDTLVLTLVRCDIKKTCPVDIESRYNRETGFNELNVASSKISVDFGDGDPVPVPIVEKKNR